ncbi:maleylpyruvate isomerase N-terminal domain-containing protein [Streptomyces sp. NPDC001780]
MTLLDYDRYCAQILDETAALRAALTGADLSVTVPTCPDWTLEELARHVGGAHRWVELIVRTRAAEAVPTEQVTGTEPDADGPAALDAWLADGAEKAVAALREAGPGTDVWSWAWERGTAFWARRMTHETLIHRADAAMAAGVRYEADPWVAADAIDEWLQLVGFVAAGEDPRFASLRSGRRRTIRLTATDAPEGLDADWLFEFGDGGFRWRRGHGNWRGTAVAARAEEALDAEKAPEAEVTLRGPLTEVLRAFYRRLPVDSELVEVVGDAELLDQWLERASFG